MLLRGGATRLSETWKGAHAAAHWDHADHLQDAQRRAPLRAAAALQHRWSPSVGHRVRRGAEPQSTAGLLPKRSEPDQREAAGKLYFTSAARHAFKNTMQL